MSKEWYIAYIGDPKKRPALPTAMQSVTSDYALWVPTRAEIRVKKENRGGNNQGRRVTNLTDYVTKPLFPGYVFINFDWSDGGAADAVKAQCGGFFLHAPGMEDPKPLSEQEVSYIKDLSKQQSQPKSIAEKYNFSLGQEVEIATGPFFGQKGLIMEVKRHTVVVEVSWFNREAVRVEITPEQCLTV